MPPILDCASARDLVGSFFEYITKSLPIQVSELSIDAGFARGSSVAINLAEGFHLNLVKGRRASEED